MLLMSRPLWSLPLQVLMTLVLAAAGTGAALVTPAGTATATTAAESEQVLTNVLPMAEATATTPIRSGGVDGDECRMSAWEMSLYCRGTRALRNVLHNLRKTDRPIVLFRGLEIVPTPAAQRRKDALHDDVADGETAEERATLLGSFADYLRSHELSVHLSELLADDVAPYAQQARDGGQEARKKDKGQGMVLAMAMMSAKMMAMLGLGGIGALAMKALGIAMMALMMAGLVGLKSLSQHGGESSHSVSYVTSEGGHHHKRRRRRSVAAADRLAYGGWPYAINGIKT